MTVRLSTALRDALVGTLGFHGALRNGRIEIRTGSQPTTADAIATGTLLGTVTASSGANTAETRAAQTITITGASGSVDSVLVNTMDIIPNETVTWSVSNDVTASLLCAAINRAGIYTATVATNVVTVRPRPGVGAAHNGYTFSTTVTTLSATVGAGTITGGVNPVNGLLFTDPASGVISKLSSQIWSFSGTAAGTAGWARFYGSPTDDGSTLSTSLVRLDGSVATSGGDFSLSNISVAIGAPNTCDTFVWTQPAA